jgi:hypothetical protein
MAEYRKQFSPQLLALAVPYETMKAMNAEPVSPKVQKIAFKPNFTSSPTHSDQSESPVKPIARKLAYFADNSDPGDPIHSINDEKIDPPITS